MDEKKYKIDGEPASAQDIIEMARVLDNEFDQCHFYQTSVAAQILRNHNHTVS